MRSWLLSAVPAALYCKMTRLISGLKGGGTRKETGEREKKLQTLMRVQENTESSISRKYPMQPHHLPSSGPKRCWVTFKVTSLFSLFFLIKPEATTSLPRTKSLSASRQPPLILTAGVTNRVEGTEEDTHAHTVYFWSVCVIGPNTNVAVARIRSKRRQFDANVQTNYATLPF